MSEFRNLYADAIQTVVSDGSEDFFTRIQEASGYENMMKGIFNSVLVIKCDKGNGFTTLLRKIERKLFSSFDDVVSCEVVFPAGLRADDQLARVIYAGLKDTDTGIISIDVSNCMSSDVAYIELLNRISSVLGREKVLYVLRMHHTNSTEDLAESKVPIYVMDVPVVSSDTYAALVTDSLNECGMRTLSNTYSTVKEIVKCYMEKPNFSGYKSVQRIALDIYHFALEYGCRQTFTEITARLYLKSISSRSEISAIEEMRSMVGMKEVADQIEEIIAFCREYKRNKGTIPKLHMLLEGPAGVGKTTIARLITKAYQQAGILKSGNMTEINARELVGSYVGQTSERAAKMIGGSHVLFIDEFYSLVLGDGSNVEYGQEALDILISALENRENDDFVCIMAGYTDDTEKALSANSGLRSRIPWTLCLEPYDRCQLLEIFMNKLNPEYSFETDLIIAASEYFEAIPDSRLSDKEFGMGRFCRNLAEKVMLKSAARRAKTGDTSLIITAEDFNKAVKTLAPAKGNRIIGFT